MEEQQPQSSLSSQVSPPNQPTYEAQVAVMRQNDRSTLYVDFLHLESQAPPSARHVLVHEPDCLQDYLLADAIKGSHYRSRDTSCQAAVLRQHN